MIKKILIIFGTRPEAIKMAPLVHAFIKETDSFQTKVCVTAQHRQMLDQVLDFFDIKPDYDLDLMQPGQNLYSLTSNVITGLKTILDDFSPDFILVHGDTTTSFAASLAGFYHGNCQVVHIEAGLRTYNKKSPYPEEMNRQLTGRLADIHFAPTEFAAKNLLREGVPQEKIFVTGNTVIDALLSAVERVESIDSNEEIANLQKLVNPSLKTITVTGHRRENFGGGFLNICKALKALARNTEDIQIIYPVHLNPNVQEPVFNLLSSEARIHLISPLSYPAFVWLMKRSYILLTDSGGVQEEAPSLNKPVLVMRNNTERQEALDAGTVRLVGTNPDLIIAEVNRLVKKQSAYNEMANKPNPYGDGKASARIIQVLKTQ